MIKFIKTNAGDSRFGVLEKLAKTGKVLESAVNLYTKIGYNFIPNFLSFEDISTSVYMKKTIA